MPLLEAQPLIQMIEAAFANTVFPGNAALLKPGDDEGEGALFVDTNWDDIDAEALIDHTFVLHCFTPAAFCYFLPAYFIASIKWPQSGLADAILGHIVVPKNDIYRPSFSNWWEKLSMPQKRAVITYVLFQESTGAIIPLGLVAALENAY